MIGNRHNGDDIAFEFLRILKVASDATATDKPADSFKPEDFLVSDPAEPTNISHSLDESIASLEDISNHLEDAAVAPAADQIAAPAQDAADDETKKVEIEADEVEVKTKGDVDVEEDEASDKKDWASDQPVNATGQYILNGLGKIAASLRTKHEHLMADMVEVTARDIMKDLVEEGVKKAGSLSALEKIAASFGKEGNAHASKVLKEAIEKIQSA